MIRCDLICVSLNRLGMLSIERGKLDMFSRDKVHNIYLLQPRGSTCVTRKLLCQHVTSVTFLAGLTKCISPWH